MAIVVLVLWLFTAGAGFYLLVTSNLGRAHPAAATPAAEPATDFGFRFFGPRGKVEGDGLSEAAGMKTGGELQELRLVLLFLLG